MPGLFGDGRHELHGAGAGADHRDPLAGEIHAVIPLSGVEGSAGKGVEAVNVGPGGTAELPAGHHQHVAAELLAGVERDRPGARFLLPDGACDLHTEPAVLEDAVIVGDLLKVALNLGLRRAWLRPVAAGRPGERIHVRRDVAGRSRVVVLPPDAANAVALLQDHVVVVSVVLQLLRCSQATEPGADDDDSHATSVPVGTPAGLFEAHSDPCHGGPTLPALFRAPLVQLPSCLCRPLPETSRVRRVRTRSGSGRSALRSRSRSTRRSRHLARALI